MDYNAFLDEINQYRGSVVAYLSIFIMYICLSPNMVQMKSEKYRIGQDTV